MVTIRDQSRAMSAVLIAEEAILRTRGRDTCADCAAIAYNDIARRTRENIGRRAIEVVRN